MEWNETRLQGSDSLALRASKKLRGKEMLLAQMGGVRLRLELDRVPLWRGDDVPVKQLVEDFAAYLCLPRLRIRMCCSPPFGRAFCKRIGKRIPLPMPNLKMRKASILD
jgi:hypothetical protein